MAYEDDDDEEVIARAEEESAPPQGITPWQPPAAEEDTSIPEAARYTAGVAPWNPPQQAQPPAGITPWNPPTEERQPPAGIKPWQPPQEQRPEAEGAIGTAAREAAGATPATLGSLTTGAATAGVGRVLGGVAGRAIGGTLGTFLGPAGTVGGWLGGGFVGGYIGDELARGIKSFLGFDDDAQRAANREANPMAAAAGQAAPLLLGLSPGRGIQAGARLLSGAIGGVTEGATQVATGDYSKEQLAANIIGGILLPGNKRWLSNIEERAAARAGGTRPAAAVVEPQTRPGELDLTAGRPGTSGGAQGEIDLGGVAPGQPRLSRDTFTGQRQLPLEPEAELGRGGQYEAPFEPRTQRDVFREDALGRAPERGAAPVEPSTAPDTQTSFDLKPTPHGAPGAEAAAGTAEAQAPPPAAKAHGPEDWGKKTAPAEGAATGVNVVTGVEPTLAHAIQAKAPAQQAGIMQDLGPRVQAILDGPSAEAAGKFREIGEAYRKVGQNGQAAKYDIVAKELDRQHALQPSEPAPATVAAARPAEVLRGPEPAAPAPTVGDQLKAKQAEKVAAAAPTGAAVPSAVQFAERYKLTDRIATLTQAGRTADEIAFMLPGRKGAKLSPTDVKTVQQHLAAKPEALRRETIERGRGGRPIKTEPLPIGTERAILEKGAERAATKGEPRELYREALGRQQQQQEQQPAAPIRPNTVRTHDGAVFTGATTNEAAARAAAAGYRPGQIFRPREAAAAPARGQPPSKPPTPPPPGGPAPGGPPPPSGAVPGSVEAANAAIRERIAKPESLLSKIPTDWEGVKKTAHDLYTVAKDALHPLKRLAGEELSPEQDFYKLARLVKGLPGRVLQQLEHGTYDIKTGKVNGDSLSKVFKSVENDENFINYAIAKHAKELEARGVKTGMPMPEVNTVIAAGASKYESVFRELVDFQGRVLTNLRKSGVISADAEARMRKMNESYIPFYRLLDPNSELGQQLGVKPGVQATDPIHKIKGSERQIIDPIDSIVKNTYLFTDAAHKNLAMQALEDWVLKNPQGNKIMRLRADEPRAVRAEVLQFMKDHGVSGEMADALENFQWTAAGKPGDNTVKVFRDGKARTYEVFDPALARSVKSMDREAFDLLTTILKQPASLLRVGATLSPEFIARNPIRDQFSAFIQSKHGYIPVYDMVRGMGHLWNKSEQFQSWLTHGGANATLVGIDRKAIGINPKDYVSRVKNVITSPFEALRVASEFAENATRMGEFLRATGKGVSPTEAAFSSREVSLDFARVGSKARALNAIIPFFNAQLEGVDRAARAFRDNPMGTLTKVGVGITLPSVALWFANKDDARYKELPQWQKDLFWIIPTDKWVDISAADTGKIGDAHKRQVNGQWQRNDGTIYRIPKPFELGVLFGSIPERALDAYYNQNPNAFKNLSKTVFEGLTPGIIPQAVLPVMEQFANRSSFLDRALIPKQLEGLPPKLQFTPQTSETAKVIGNIISTFNPKTSFASPIIIDNYIKQYTGGLGSHVVDLMDKSLEAIGAVTGKTPPTSTTADMPLLKAFAVRFPSAGAQSVQDFYDTYGERKTAIAEAKFQQKRGEPIDTALQNPGEAIHQQIGALHRKIREAYESTKLSPEQKRDFIDNTYLQIIETARRGNVIYERTKRQRP